MGKQLTLRNVSSELASRLARLAEARGQSVNATAIELLERATGIDGRRERLARYTTWTEEDREELDRALKAQRTVDDELWR